MIHADPTPPGCDEFDPNALTVDAARARILGSATPVEGFEQLPIRDGLGRVLFSDVAAPLNVPPYDNSAMDGYAVVGGDLPESGTVSLTLAGTALAGQPFAGTVQSGQCVRIMTGGKIPEGADTVIMQEHSTEAGGRIRIGHGHHAGQNVRRAGEDIAIGQRALAAGRRLNPADIGLLASLGIGEVSVRRRVRVAFFSTGDELRPVGTTLADGQIYDSNRYTLHGMLTRLQVELIDMGVVPDRRDAVEQAFHDASRVADVIVSSGGVSVGQADYVKDTLARLGEVSFWKIAMKPGRPLAVGRINEALFFGLPGNPVSAMVTFYQFVQPALMRMMGCADYRPLTLMARCTTALKKRAGRQDFQRGILEHDSDGQLTVRSVGEQGSGILSSMSQANCFIILPLEAGNLPAGEPVVVQPFAGII